MFGVLCLHCNVHYQFSILACLLFKSAVFSIPLFFMVSGYLMASKSNIDYRYCWRKIWGILKFSIGISLPFCLLQAVFKDSFDIISIVRSVIGNYFQLPGGRFGVFWYFGAMIIIYAVLPLISRLFKYKKIHILLLLGGVILLMVFVLNLLIGMQYEHPFEHYIKQTFRVWNWIFYFLLGAYIKNYNLNVRITLKIIALLFVFNFIHQVILQQYMNSLLCEYFYSSPIVIILVLSLFLWLRNWQINMQSTTASIILFLSNLFLPVYVFHMFVISYMKPAITLIYSSCSVIAPIIVWLLVSFVIITFSYLLMRIPYMSKFFKI